MECQVVGCNNEAKYWDYFTGHCGDSRRVKVAVCREHYLEGYCYSHCENKEEVEARILREAERIEV